MLQRLEIHNIALIDHIVIDLGKGLNILTGETGAGKSIIIDSINAILGSRLSRDIIRTGKEKAIVEAAFQIDYKKLEDIFENMGLEPESDGTLIISREFSISGKNICRINGRMATVSVLKEIGERIIDIHGQYDNQSLLRSEGHIELLDSFGGEVISSLKHEYKQELEKYKEIKNRLKSLSGDKNERERKIDLIKYQINEIKKAKLKTNEEEELNKQKTILGNSEKITGSLSRTYELIFSGNNIKDSASDTISQALLEINSIAKFNENYMGISKRIEEISYQLDDITGEIRKLRENIEYSPELIEQVEERLDLIYKLKKKYGNSIKDVIAYCEKIEFELDEIVKSEEIINELFEKLLKTNKILYDTAKQINLERTKSCSILEDKIALELDELEMKRAKFKVNIEFDDISDNNGDRKFQSTGLDKVEFLISPNAGEPLKQLSKIASGGEMSRIMLAIKNILADADKVPTLIFDEIDIGVSGRAAQKVGEKLSCISRNHQVICVTHLAQIACMAEDHYLIEKLSNDENTHTQVKKLYDKEIKEDIARILGGSNISEITLKHAEEMLQNSQNFKNSMHYK
jgi:DNA repair protein RecN (Recombination protein N)